MSFKVKITLTIFLTPILLILTGITPLIHSANAISSIGPWNPTQPLPYSLASHTSLSNSGRVFVINGSATFAGTHTEVIESQVLADSSLSTWTTVSTIYPPTIWHSTTTSGDFVYVLGGVS